MHIDPHSDSETFGANALLIVGKLDKKAMRARHADLARV